MKCYTQNNTVKPKLSFLCEIRALKYTLFKYPLQK